jgi:hypothetical protein
MKKYLVLILLTTPLFAWPQRVKKNVIYKPIKSFFLDLNNDGKIDTVSISASALETGYNFNRILIKLAGFPKKTFTAKDGWGDIDHWFLDSNENLVHSKQVFIKKTPLQTVIIVSGGTDGAGNGGEFSIINIENNQIKMVFDDNGELDVELPSKLIDLKNDGRLDFIYKDLIQVYKAAKGGMIGTYMPYFVYPVTDTCKLDTGLMKFYNKNHYVFAGFKFSDKIQIYYPNDRKRKPRVWYIPKNLL